MAKNKYYVVWEGRNCGVFDNWAECSQQVADFPNAKYKSFETKEAAIEAYRAGFKHYIKPKSTPVADTSKQPIYPSLAVDAACSGVPGPMEYQGVDAYSKKLIFHLGPIPDGTNNVGEFLAIVHALALLQKQGRNYPIYSDSITAIAWVRNKKANTKMLPTHRNTYLFELIQRAEDWLKNNTFSNKILKWETSIWGEIPADFGRK